MRKSVMRAFVVFLSAVLVFGLPLQVAGQNLVDELRIMVESLGDGSFGSGTLSPGLAGEVLIYAGSLAGFDFTGWNIIYPFEPEQGFVGFSGNDAETILFWERPDDGFANIVVQAMFAPSAAFIGMPIEEHDEALTLPILFGEVPQTDAVRFQPSLFAAFLGLMASVLFFAIAFYRKAKQNEK